MKHNFQSLLRCALRDQNAQVLPMMALMMVAFIGFAGCVIDVGKVYYAYNELLASTQAAALAGGQAISNTEITVLNNSKQAIPDATPQEVAAYYSSQTQTSSSLPVLGTNANPIFQTVSIPTPFPQVSCNSTLEAAPYNISCITYNGGGSSTANAIQVEQQATVTTWFVGLFGAKSITLTAYASAARAGAATTPYNVAIVVDSTASMQTTDDNCSFGKISRFQCALDGVQVLLENMAPCYSSETTCGTATNGITATPIDIVSLFTFPNFTTASMPYEYCNGGAKGSSCAYNTSGEPVPEPYTYPSTSATSYTSLSTSAGNVSYLVTYASGGVGSGSNGFVNDYKTDDPTSTLNTSSDLVKAIGCCINLSTDKPTGTLTAGMDAAGGEGTYYAGVIYAAEAALYAELQARPGSQNVLIILSDGDASASQSQMQSTNNGYTLSKSGTYPSYNDECSQAVTAAGGTIGSSWTPDTSAFTTARASVERVYAIAYGSETGNCANDTISPCDTMKEMASNSGYFYSDNNQSGAGNDATCVGTGATTSLAQIFTDIASDFSNSRLIPNAVFGGT